MKLTPTPVEKSVCLVLVLFGMSWLIPQCWVTNVRWAANDVLCSWWICCYVGLLLMACAVAGTKRQVILGLALAATIIPWFLWDHDIASVSWGNHQTPYVGASLSGFRFVSDAAIRLLAIAASIFVASFGLSFLLDRHVGPVVGTEEKQLDKGASNAKPTNKRSLLQVLIPFLVALFIVQAAGNVLGTRFGGSANSARYLLPLGVACLIVFGVGLICRMKTISACIAGVMLVIAAASGIFALAIQRGDDASVIGLLVFLGGCTAVVGCVFALLGRGRKQEQFQFSWLSLLLSILCLGTCWIGTNYDLYTLALEDEPFDFSQAAFVKRINSASGVKIKHEHGGGRGSVQFEFSPSAANENLLNDFSFHGFAKTKNYVSITGMGPSVDLSRFEELQPRTVSVFGCQLSPTQLRELCRPGARIWISDCSFVPEPIEGDDLIVGSQVHIHGGVKSFLLASQEVKLESSLSLHFDEPMDSEDLENVVAILRRSAAVGAEIHVSDPENLKGVEHSRLQGQPELSQIMCHYCDVALTSNGRAANPRVFELILESEIGVNANVFDKLLALKLQIASNGVFSHNQNLVEFPELKLESIEESIFVYSRNESGDPTKIWIPWSDDATVKACSEIESLESLSFDVDWLEDSGMAADFSARGLTQVNGAKINQLRNLRELYFSTNEAVDLSKLTDLKQVETLQFSTGSKGFRHELFPNLKEVRLLVDANISNGLMNELSKSKTLRSLVVVDTFAVNFSREQFLLQANRLFGGRVKVSATASDDDSQLIPDDFKSYRIDLRKQCIQEYLGR